MIAINRYIGIGNLTRDIELRTTGTNKAVANFTIAINEGYGDKKTVEYVNAVAWENVATNLSKYCKKGSKIAIEGKLHTSKYDKNGVDVYKTEVICFNIEFLDTKNTEVKTDRGSQTNRVKNIDIDNSDLPF